MKTKITIALMALAVIFMNCKKETVKGDKGDAGTNGTNGTANITAFTFTTSTSSWVMGCANQCYAANNPITGLTASNVDQAAVMCYQYSSGNLDWTALPFTSNDYQTRFSYTSANITIKFSSATGTTSFFNPGTQVYKVVVIPPAMIKPNVHLENYNEVKTAYNL